MRIRSDFSNFTSVHFDPALFIPSPSNGGKRFLLDRIGDELARATSIVEYAPCSSFPSHSHAGGEEFLVLKGTFHDEHGSYPTGHYVRNPIGSHHAPFVKEDGCTIFVKLLQMADEPENVGAPSADEAKGPRSVSVGVSFSDATKNAAGRSRSSIGMSGLANACRCVGSAPARWFHYLRQRMAKNFL
jgi:ChrR Cupin-like domain